MNKEPTPIEAWEAAYRRFESPQQEQQKFQKRLRKLRVDTWNRDLKICELFCGRGNGLYVWQILGFSHIEGLDLSPELVADYKGTAAVRLGDARCLPHEDGSLDVIVVQGGLHHLRLMDDLHQTLAEISRVLKPNGRLILVEPWLTPFLRFVHMSCSISIFRRTWAKLDALAAMIDLERDTYEDWLSRPKEILAALSQVVDIEQLRTGWGKLMLVGKKKLTNAPP